MRKLVLGLAFTIFITPVAYGKKFPPGGGGGFIGVPAGGGFGAPPPNAGFLGGPPGGFPGGPGFRQPAGDSYPISGGLNLPTLSDDIPLHSSKAAVVELLEDDANRLAPKLEGGTGKSGEIVTAANLYSNDVFTGSSCLKVVGYQRFSEKIPNWRYRIVEKPREGEYRYLRFAWKVEKGTTGYAGGLMIQLHANSVWGHRYHVGENAVGFYPSKPLNAKLPTEWEVVTIDLYAEHKALELTGFAFTPMNGTALFDHMYLGRTIEDLDKVTNAATKWAKEKAKIDETRFRQLWKDLASQDAAVYAPAQWELASNPETAAKFLKEAIKIDDGKGSAEKVAKLLRDLDAKKYATRELAQLELASMGPEILPFLIAARNPKNSTDFEVRLEALITEFRSQEFPEWGTEELRSVRSLRALEQAGGKDAKALLEEVSKSVMGKGIPGEAKACLSRMK